MDEAVARAARKQSRGIAIRDEVRNYAHVFRDRDGKRIVHAFGVAAPSRKKPSDRGRGTECEGRARRIAMFRISRRDAGASVTSGSGNEVSARP